METQARRNEVEIEGGVAQTFEAVPELFECPRREAQGHQDFDVFAEVEALEGRLPGEFWLSGAVVGDQAAQIAAQPGDGKVVANVENGELLGEFAAVGGREHPLREVVGKTLGEEGMRSEGLIGVMEDGGVAA